MSRDLESYFAPFRANIIGIDQTFESPIGLQKLLYADWTATGRAYRPVETSLLEDILPFFANTHTGNSFTGKRMTAAYEAAKDIVKNHVHAGPGDVLLFCGSGMTSAVNKLQRLLGLRLPPWAADRTPSTSERPLVLVTHMEHHSNHISWLETIAQVEIIPSGKDGNVDLEQLEQLLQQHRHRRLKIAAVTACSNVTGIETPYHAIAAMMHRHDGHCFVDLAAAAPYTGIDMHPADPEGYLDAIYFSGHKFLGGPGTPGVLLFNKKLYKNNNVPDQPGGGTLLYTNPWKTREYLQDIEQREDGGTPPILQAIKLGLCIQLKERMGVGNIRARETALTNSLLSGLKAIPGIQVLAPANTRRLGIVSFTVNDGRYNEFVQSLNDHFGIQCRGGCSCAGTYGHFLLDIDAARSYAILNRLRAGDHDAKPGWVRLSIHPTTTDAEIAYIIEAVTAVAGDARLIDHPNDVSCPVWPGSKNMMSSLSGWVLTEPPPSGIFPRPAEKLPA